MALPRQAKPRDRRKLRTAWAAEHAAADAARADGDRRSEWGRLERAHVLSQPLAVAHVRTHLAMLGYGVRQRDLREVVGQLGRTVVAAPGSLTRRYPLGNTGGARVSATRPMPIPVDLRPFLPPS